MSTPSRGSAIAFILKGYPRLSETFIAQEIWGLEQQGLDIRIFAMRLPTDRTLHPVHRQIRAPVSYLPEYLHWQPWRVLRAWWRARRLPQYQAARQLWLADLRRDRSRNRVRRFGQALVLAVDLPPETGWLHAHFLHTPASVTRYAAALTGLPWSASAHAKDIWTTPDWEIREKLADLRWLVTCTRTNAAHLAPLAPEPARISLAYHGLDRRRFPAPTADRPQRDGTEPADPVVLLSVGRAVEKKGFDVLLDALALIPPALAWRLVHIGGGDLLNALRRRARRLGLSPRIAWLGPLPQQEVLAHYRAADLFVLACRVAADGDRDGLPNVFLEAQSQGLAVVSTAVSAIPELIKDGTSGLLVPPEDPQALAAAIALLIAAPDQRLRLGAAGMHRVEALFSYRSGLEKLVRLFRQEIGETGDSSFGRDADRLLRSDEASRPAAAVRRS